MPRFHTAMFILAATLLSARPADAAVVTLNYAGQWSFFDPQQDAPGFWAAMASVGVVPGTDVFWSLTIDSAATDQNSDPTVGLYDAVLGSTLRAGSLNLATGPAQLVVSQSSGPGFVSIGNMGPAVQGYVPQYFQLSSFGQWGLPTDALLPALTQIGSGPGSSSMFLGFNQGSALFLGVASLKLVSVPAPSTLPLAVAGITVFALYRVRSSRSRG